MQPPLSVTSAHSAAALPKLLDAYPGAVVRAPCTRRAAAALQCMHRRLTGPRAAALQVAAHADEQPLLVVSSPNASEEGVPVGRMLVLQARTQAWGM